MSSHDSADINSNFLSAEEVDVGLLLKESARALKLDAGEEAEMSIFLSEAWFTGVRAGHSQVLGRRAEPDSPPAPADLKSIEARFRSLMERSADTLNLSATLTIKAWGLLSRAWMAGAHAYQAELTAMLLERGSDIAEEALEWLGELGGDQA